MKKKLTRMITRKRVVFELKLKFDEVRKATQIKGSSKSTKKYKCNCACTCAESEVYLSTAHVIAFASEKRLRSAEEATW